MATHTLNPIRGSTAIGSVTGQAGPSESPARHPAHPRHLIGSAMRAVGVFAETAFRVIVLGTDGTKQPDILR